LQRKLKHIHPALVLRTSGVPEKAGINQKGINQKWHSHKK